MFLSYAWKELTRRKTRSALSIVGIFFSIALLVSVIGITDAVNKTVRTTFAASGADMTVQRMFEPGPYEGARYARHLGPVPAQALEQIRALPQVETVSGQLHIWSWDPGKKAMITVAGVDPAAEKDIGPLMSAGQSAAASGKCCTKVTGRALVPGDTYSAILDNRYAAIVGLSIGSVVNLKGKDFPVVGLADLRGVTRVAQAEVFIPLKAAQELVAPLSLEFTGQNEVVNLLMIRLHKGADIGQMEEKVRGIVSKATGAKPKMIQVFTSTNILPEMQGLSILTQGVIKILSILVLIGVALLVVKAALAGVAERTREIGILKAIGWRNSEVSRLITIETGLQGVLGGVLGCLVGYLITYLYAANADLILPHMMNPFPCVPAIPPPTDLSVNFFISWPLVVGALAIAVGLGAISGYFASRSAAKLQPVEALRRM